MAVTHDERDRDLVNCASCGRLERKWRRLVLSSDGGLVLDVQLCRACETYAVDAVKLTLRAVLVKP